MARRLLRFALLTAGFSLGACQVDTSNLTAGGGGVNSAGAAGLVAGAGGAAGGSAPSGGQAGTLSLAGVGGLGGSGGGSAGSGGQAGSAAGSAGSSQGGSAGGPACASVTEVCNGADDNCNGLVDEGCSATVTWTASHDSPTLGESLGGNIFADPCAAGDVLVGYHVGMGTRVNQLGAICRTIAVTPNPGAIPPYQALLGTRHDLDLHPPTVPDTQNTVQELVCPDGFVVGSVGVVPFTADTGEKMMLQFSLSCAPLRVEAIATGAIIDADTTQTIFAEHSPILCVTCSAAQETPATIASGQLPRGVVGAGGDWLDRFAIAETVAQVNAK